MNCRNIILLLVIIFFTSCEKNIDFVTQQKEASLVVEGIIEDGKAPQVILTKSLDYFSNITPQIALNSFARNAIVTINNGTVTHQLKEYEQNLGIGYKTYYYSIDSSNLSTAFVGEQNKSYSLKIVFEGKEYTSQTTIPKFTKTCDSLWWRKQPNNNDTNAILVGRFIDPVGLGNYIRYFTKTNSEPFLPGPKSAFDDQVIDGKTYNVDIDKGVNRNLEIDLIKDNVFKRGDSVTLKFCNTDKATYTFWNTWEFAYQAIGNPFSTPNKVLGNISNNALGAFCGYSVQYKTLVIPK
ncbi:MAG: DUF4249 domain-containing protein [Bacteroidetes bacterium]|nr:DUF4249 domain-containing protein [Bacteroidota bacterium]